MKIRSKLILLMVLCAALTLVFVGGAFEIKDRWLNAIFTLEAKDLESRCDRIITLVGQPLETFAYDYTFWDEMAAFVKTADPVWAKENIDPSLGIYKADGAWVYALDGKSVYSVRSPAGDALHTVPLPPGAVRKLFEHSRFCHFYARAGAGLLEVRGATIHPSADSKRETPPRGYFFVGRLWTKGYTDMLGGLIPAAVSIDVERLGQRAENDPYRGVIAFDRSLRDWTGVTIAVMRVNGESQPVKMFRGISKVTLTAFVLFAAVLIMAVAAFMMRWVISPLAVILRSLNEQNPAILRGTTLRKDEFARIAELMRESFEEHDLLVAEVAARKKADEELSLFNERFLKTFRAAPGMMSISKLETGEIIDSNDAFTRISGYSRQELIGHTSTGLGIMDAATHARIIRKLRHDGAVRHDEVEIRTKAGEKRVCLFSGESMDVRGEDVMIAIFLDITLRKRAEDELRRKVDELERFNKMAVGREARMVELKERIRELEERLR